MSDSETEGESISDAELLRAHIAGDPDAFACYHRGRYAALLVYTESDGSTQVTVVTGCGADTPSAGPSALLPPR